MDGVTLEDCENSHVNEDVSGEHKKATEDKEHEAEDERLPPRTRGWCFDFTSSSF